MVNKYDNYELRKVNSLKNAPGTIKDGDGYIWDPSELPDKDFDDSKVPLNYRRLAIWMRSKLFGKDVRETIARLAEMFGLNFKELMDSFASLDNRQDAVETYTSQSVAQMEADKNAVIANVTVDSEVILARGGKATLGARLDETTAQLAETDLKLSDVGINVRDFGVIPNDPSVDNYEAIIDALDYATDHGIATLVFPTGETYTSPISLEGYQYIKFKGQSSYNYADYGTPITHKETSIRFVGTGEYGIQTAEPIMSGWSAKGISFEDITLNGDKKVNHVVNAKYNTTFKNVVARGGLECGIVLENATYPVKLTDTHANFNGKHGIWVRSPNTTVYSIINSEFSRNDGYGMLIEGSAGSSFKNITVQDNKQGGVKINSPDGSAFTQPVYLQTLGFDTLYTEANGQLETTHPNYEGNWALLITGVGSVRPRKIAFNNSTINQSSTGGTIKVDYGEDIYFDLNTAVGKKIEINRDRERVIGVRFAPVSLAWQTPKITYYGDGTLDNAFTTPYQPSDILGYEMEGAWVGNRGRTSIYEFFKSDIAQRGAPVSMETQSGNGESYHTLQAGSVLLLSMTAKNRATINGTLNIEVQTRSLINGTWATLKEDSGQEMKYTWKTSEVNYLLKRFRINRYKLSGGQEIRVIIDSNGHNVRADNNFTVNLLVEY